MTTFLQNLFEILKLFTKSKRFNSICTADLFIEHWWFFQTV